MLNLNFITKLIDMGNSLVNRIENDNNVRYSVIRILNDLIGKGHLNNDDSYLMISKVIKRYLPGKKNKSVFVGFIKRSIISNLIKGINTYLINITKVIVNESNLFVLCDTLINDYITHLLSYNFTNINSRRYIEKQINKIKKINDNNVCWDINSYFDKIMYFMKIMHYSQEAKKYCIFDNYIPDAIKITDSEWQLV